jgi:penicillin-binding protein 1A
VPIWVHFMREALKGVPQRERPMPPGLIQVRISPDTGTIASIDDPFAIFETYMADRLPTGGVLGAGEGFDFGGGAGADGMGADGQAQGAQSAEPLF